MAKTFRAFDAQKVFYDMLLKHGASERAAKVFIELRGLGDCLPISLRKIDVGLSFERVRQIIVSLESGSLKTFLASKDCNDLKQVLQEDMRLLESLAPNSDAVIAGALKNHGIEVKHPSSLVRLADLVGFDHDLRLSVWTSKAKTMLSMQSSAKREDLGGGLRLSTIAITPKDMPEIFDSFINFARKFSRGSGVVGSRTIADEFSNEKRIPVSEIEANAFLMPFANGLGRHEGQEWYAFLNSPNDFLRKAETRVDAFNGYSFDFLCEFHQRYNRSLYAKPDNIPPKDVLRQLLELSGLVLDGDMVRHPDKGRASRNSAVSISPVQAKMIKVFRKAAGNSPPNDVGIKRSAFMSEMIKAGIKETTAHIYLGNKGLFQTTNGFVKLAFTN